MEEDFDFSIYGEEEKQEINIDKKPQASYLRSRYSNWERFLTTIADLRDSYVKYSVEVRAGSNDITIYRKFFGHLDAIWSQLEYMQGSINETKVNRIRDACENLLKRQKDSQNVPEKLRKLILLFENKINRIQWHCNLNVDVEKIGRGARAKELIVN